jgi:hypothetical protein
MISRISIDNKENWMLNENGFTIIAISGEGKFKRRVLVTDKVILLSETYILVKIML